MSTFVIPKRKEADEDDVSFQEAKQHSKKHKKKKHHHHHDNRVEPLNITKPQECQSKDPGSSQSVDKHLSPHHSSASSPLKKLSIVIPKLNSSPIPTSSPLLTYSPVQVQADNDGGVVKQDVPTAQAKQSSTADLTSK